jgi:hypothetical protein
LNVTAPSELWPRNCSREIVLSVDFRPKKIHCRFVERRKRIKKLLTLTLLALLALSAKADDHRKTKPAARRDAEPNYILRRQEAYQVQGVPTDRLIIGKREIDIYPNGLMFEGDHVVGITR